MKHNITFSWNFHEFLIYKGVILQSNMEWKRNGEGEEERINDSGIQDGRRKTALGVMNIKFS